MTKRLFYLMWVPGLFWLAPVWFCRFGARVPDKWLLAHGLWTGLQVSSVIFLLQWFCA